MYYSFYNGYGWSICIDVDDFGMILTDQHETEGEAWDDLNAIIAEASPDGVVWVH